MIHVPHTAAFQSFAIEGGVTARFMFTRNLQLTVIDVLGISNFITPSTGTSNFKTPPRGISEFTTPSTGKTEL